MKTYKIAYKNTNGEIMAKDVSGYPVPNNDGLKLFVWHAGDHWQLTEATTGMMVGSFLRKRDAMEYTKVWNDADIPKKIKSVLQREIDFLARKGLKTPLNAE